MHHGIPVEAGGVHMQFGEQLPIDGYESLRVAGIEAGDEPGFFLFLWVGHAVLKVKHGQSYEIK